MKALKDLLTKLTSLFQRKDKSSRGHSAVIDNRMGTEHHSNMKEESSGKVQHHNTKNPYTVTQVDISSQKAGSTCTLNLGSAEDSRKHQGKCHCVTLTISLLLSIIAIAFSGALALRTLTSSGDSLCLPCTSLELEEEFSRALLHGLRRYDLEGVQQCCARTPEETRAVEKLIQRKIDITQVMVPDGSVPATAVSRDDRRQPYKRDVTSRSFLAHLILDVKRNEKECKQTDDVQKVIHWQKDRELKRTIFQNGDKFNFSQGTFEILIPGVYEIYSHVHLKLDNSNNDITVIHKIMWEYGIDGKVDDLLLDSKVVPINDRKNTVTSSLRGHFSLTHHSKIYVMVSHGKSITGAYSNYFGIKYIANNTS